MSNLLDHITGGATGLFVGPPKTGKSTILGSSAELVDPERIKLFSARPNEVNSWLYEKHGISETAEVFRDIQWQPILDLYEASAFTDAHRRVLDLYKDDSIDVVLVEFTDFVLLAKHNILKANNASSPDDLPGKSAKIGFYGKLKDDLKDFTQSLVGLSSPDLDHPKHVFVAIHAQPTKEEDIKGKETPEGKAKGIQYFGDVLPMVEGGYRQDIAGEFGMVGYTTIKHDTQVVDGKIQRTSDYVVQIAADAEKHGGARYGPALSEKELPNNLSAIFEAFAVEEAA